MARRGFIMFIEIICALSDWLSIQKKLPEKNFIKTDIKGTFIDYLFFKWIIK